MGSIAHVYRENTWGSPSPAPSATLAMASAEFERLVRTAPRIRIAFQDRLILLSEDLHADGMITDDNKSEVLNQSRPKPERAARLLDLVLNRVKVVKGSYQTFVKLLRRNRDYKAILQISKSHDDRYQF